MKHLFWAVVINAWLAIAGWATLSALGRPQLATSVGHTGAAISIGCVVVWVIGLFNGALDE